MNALAYARNHWPVMPLNGKLPLTEHGSKDATTDPNTVQQWLDRWPDMNVGLATGHRFVVVDLDGPEGVQSWRDLTAKHGRADTATVRTGSGGWHLYYRVPQRGNVNSAKKLGPGIDTRGRGGYVVAPPSIHPNGTPYEWKRQCSLAEFPAWAAAILEPAPLVVAAHVDVSVGGDSAIVGLSRTVARAGEGTRNDVLNWASYQAGRKHADVAEARANLVGAAVAAGLAEQEADRTFRSGYMAGLKDGQARPLIDYRPARLEPARLRIR